MQRLLYISTARKILPHAELDEILRASRRNNAAAGVSGLLVAGGRRFLQLLEGPEDSVDTLFARIKQDPRHFAVVILSKKTVAAPLTAQWAMGYYSAGGTAGDRRSLPEIVDDLIGNCDDPALHAEFTQFALRHAA
jgi:hypothetical protein